MTTTLLCLPFAGAGASVFSSWRGLGGDGLHIRALQLPGRERRLGEPLVRDAHAAADLLAHEVSTTVPTGPLAVFGHSLGAVLAYELTLRLLASQRLVSHLFVSGAGPDAQRTALAGGLDDEEFLAGVERITGYRHPAFDVPQLRAVLLPALRADVHMHESYRPCDAKPIDVGVTTLRGTGDVLVGAQEMALWSRVTTAPIRKVELPGDHMYVVDSGAAVVDVVADVLRGERALAH
jgi:surfactin synthase thioesterase subunit